MYKGRKGRPLSPQKGAFARGEEDAGLAQGVGTDLSKAVRLVKPSSLIGAAARGGAFSEDVIRALHQVPSPPDLFVEPLCYSQEHHVSVMLACAYKQCRACYGFLMHSVMLLMLTPQQQTSKADCSTSCAGDPAKVWGECEAGSVCAFKPGGRGGVHGTASV